MSILSSVKNRVGKSALIGLALAALFTTSAFAVSPTVRDFAASITPTTSVASAVQAYTLTVTASASNASQTIKSIKIIVPAGWNATGFTVPAGWTANLSGSEIDIEGTGSNKLNAGNSLALGFSGSAPALAGDSVWTTTAYSGSNYGGSSFSITTSQPTVTVTAAVVTPVINVLTYPATDVTESNATLNGTNGPSNATGHSFWVSLADYSTASPSIPSGVYSTIDMGAINAFMSFTSLLSDVTTSGVPSNMPAVTPDTTYYYNAWSLVGGTWYPGEILTFTTGSALPPPEFVQVHIYKYLDTDMATPESASSTSFAMASSWDAANLGGAGSGTYSLNAAGYGDGAYIAVTSPMTYLSDYSTNEVLDGAIVAETCANNAQYNLVGYKIGNTLDAAEDADTVPEVVLNDITSDKYVIVVNHYCNTPAQLGTVTVKIRKYIDGAVANTESASSTIFHMQSSWSDTPDAGAGTYTLEEGNSFNAETSPMQMGTADYATSETFDTDTAVACNEASKFELVGYTVGDSFAEAAGLTPSLTLPSFTNLQSNKFVIVWNKTCIHGPVVSTPVHLSPADNTVTTTALQTEIDWTDSTDSNSLPVTYIYQASNDGVTNLDGSFTNPIYTSGVLTESKIPTPGTPAGVYYWHVMATDGTDSSPWTSAWKITIDNTPSEPEPEVCIESSTFDDFILGSVNGQSLWSATGPYDQAIVNNTYGFATFGCKTLRVSDAITSGSFGDWIFAAPNANAVGETEATTGGFSEGTRQNHFEAEFDIASTQATLQPGLHVSVSPDRGDGSRMSYVRFEDQANGVHVFFIDVPGGEASIGTENEFVETDIATLDRTAPHTIKITLDTIDGPTNDVVTVRVDGTLVHTGTSWEDYYRFDPEAAAEQSPRIVKTLIIQARGGANPDNSGKGFLFDNFSLDSSNDEAPVVTDDVDDETPPVTSVSGGGTGFGFGGGNGGGQVLGASTGPDGEGLTCPAFITSFLIPGKANNQADVVRLQVFLNNHESAGLKITGNYDAATIAAVNALQAKYADKILAPWVAKGLLPSLTPTGNVGKMTQWFINVAICGMTTPAPELP